MCKKIVEMSMPDGNHGLHAEVAQLEKNLCTHQIAKNLEASMKIWDDVFAKQVLVLKNF